MEKYFRQDAPSSGLPVPPREGRPAAVGEQTLRPSCSGPWNSVWHAADVFICRINVRVDVGGAQGPTACQVLHKMVIRLLREFSFLEKTDLQATSRVVHAPGSCMQ